VNTGARKVAMRSLLVAVQLPGFAVLGGILLGGCVSQRCYDDPDCPASTYCDKPSGLCVQRCHEDRDCPAPRFCDKPSGLCVECDLNHPCASGLECVANHCQEIPSAPIECPADMVAVAETFCADKYEASRPDATATSSGRDGSRAMSVAGVLPWMVADNATAELACGASGKRLCTPEEWRTACVGPDGTKYAYGDSYAPLICNGIDSFPGEGFHLAPTGSFAGCTNEWGLYDINGNLWEHVAGGSDMTVRGGAFNCLDSATLHRCDYIPGNWTPSARGFRCCRSPSPQPGGPDGGAPAADARSDLAADGTGANAAADGGEGGAGCVDDDGGQPDVTAILDARADASADARDAGPDVPDGDAPASDAPLGSDGSPLEAAADLVPDAPVAGDAEPAPCPPEMALVGSVCIDRYEASRQDATGTSAGHDDSVAWSQRGVLPWYVNPMSTEAFEKFQAACAASGKRLCEPGEWLEACQGPAQNTYVFGDTWDPEICNSVDTYCQECCDILGLAICPTGENCGYSSSLTSSYTPETCFLTADYGLDTCHVCFHVMPTGSFPKCTSGNGLYDVNGNVWEVVPVPTSEDSRGYQVRGGAFNCGSPSARFACTFNAGWTDLYAGFRCCKDPSLL
jgi:formylglycine-generating enzyme required for sulfatase activity